jgi:hypothetical protein
MYKNKPKITITSSAPYLPSNKKSSDKKMSDSKERKPKKFIQDMISSPGFKKGAFKAKAEKAGDTTREFASKVTKNKGKFSKETVKQAVLAKTLMSFHKKKK